MSKVINTNRELLLVISSEVLTPRTFVTGSALFAESLFPAWFVLMEHLVHGFAAGYYTVAVAAVILSCFYTVVRISDWLQPVPATDATDLLRYWLSLPVNQDLRRQVEDQERATGHLRRFIVEGVRREAIDRLVRGEAPLSVPPKAE